MGLREKVRELYSLIPERGLYVCPEQNIKFGNPRVVDINNNGSESISLHDESYNATLLFSLFNGIRRRGAMVYFGPPGAGKTSLAELVGHFIYGQTIQEIQNATIYGHPEHTESSIVARLHTGKLIQGTEEVIPREFLKSKVKIIDEVNRLLPGKLSILYQLVDRGYVNYLSERIVAEEGPIFATANAPDSGNYPLPIPFLDRFDLAVVVNELNPFFLDALMAKGDGNARDGYGKLFDIPTNLKVSEKEIEDGRTEISKVALDTDAFYFIVNFIAELNYCNEAGVDLEHKTKAFALNKKPSQGLCANCHYKGQVCSFTDNDLSPRTYSAIIAHSRTMAWFRGKDKASIEDVEQILPYTIWHKLHPTRYAFDKNSIFENDRIAFVRDLIGEVKKNYTSFKKGFKKYDNVLERIAEYATGGAKVARDKPDILVEIDSVLAELKKIDSVVKFPMAITLAQLSRTIK